MSIIQFLFGFQGRIRRSHLWLFYLGMCVAFAVLFLLFHKVVVVDHGVQWRSVDGVYALGGHGYSIAAFYVPWLGLAGLVAGWMKLAVLVKRWHDRDKSGWWVFITLIPVIGPIWQGIECFFLPGTDGPNKYGPSPK